MRLIEILLKAFQWTSILFVCLLCLWAFFWALDKFVFSFQPFDVECDDADIERQRQLDEHADMRRQALQIETYQ